MILTFHNTFASLNLFCGLTTDSLFLNMYHIVASGWSFITCLLLCAICYALIQVSLNVLAAFTTIYSYPSDNLSDMTKTVYFHFYLVLKTHICKTIFEVPAATSGVLT